VVLKARPGVGKFVEDSCFEIAGGTEEKRGLKDGETRVELLALSVDPYMRCRFNEKTGADYLTPFQAGEPIRSGGVVKVLQSKHENFNAGDILVSQMHMPWVQEQVFKPEEIPDLAKVEDPKHAMLSCGPLGIAGLSAFFGVKQSKPVQGELAVLSSCAGAVGSIGGQLLRSAGVKVIGTCGSKAKCDWSKAHGVVDVALCYKDDNFEAQLAGECKESVNLYFDNVGGAQSELIIKQLAPKGRVIVCGQISTYNQDTGSENYVYPDPLSEAVEEHLKSIEGTRERFFVGFYEEQYADALQELHKLFESGKLQVPVDWTSGLQNAGNVFVRMMKGEFSGKVLINCRPSSQE